MLHNISSYDNKIKTIELFVDSVRKNPGEYLSSTGQNNDLKQENLESSPYGQEWMNAL